MKRILIALLLGSVIVAAFAMYQSFYSYHRAYNKDAPRPVIRVFTHSSFMAPTGPGPEIAALFEPACLCKIEFIDAGSGGLLLQKLKLGGAEQPDIVIGLDQLILKEAVTTVKWRNLSLPARNWHEVVEHNSYANFLPYDWSPLTFIVRADNSQPQSILDRSKAATTVEEFILNLPPRSLALPDPSLSTPGAQFLFWLFTYHSDEELKELFQALSPKIYAVTPDWSSAYGLFRRGQAKLALSYLTSLAYHWQDDKDRSYQAIIFKDPHPAQIEYAGVPDTCMSCGLAERFAEFLTSDQAQKIIMQKNYMFPVVKNITHNTIFAELPEVKVLRGDQLDRFLRDKPQLLKHWQEATKK